MSRPAASSAPVSEWRPYPSLQAVRTALLDDDHVVADTFRPGLEVVLDGVERWKA